MLSFILFGLISCSIFLAVEFVLTFLLDLPRTPKDPAMMRLAKSLCSPVLEWTAELMIDLATLYQDVTDPRTWILVPCDLMLIFLDLFRLTLWIVSLVCISMSHICYSVYRGYLTLQGLYCIAIDGLDYLEVLPPTFELCLSWAYWSTLCQIWVEI